MRNLTLLLISIFPLLLMTGCNDSTKENTGKKQIVPDTEDSGNNNSSSYKGLTSEYLAGDWCYTHYHFVDPSNKSENREEINRNFKFALDGTYITQQASSAPMTTNGKYEFLPNGFFQFIIGKTTVVSVETDNFVLHKLIDHHFRRGACN